MKRRLLIAAAPAALAFRPHPGRTAELRKITITVASTAFAASGIRVAKELGLFESNGLVAKIIVMDSGNAAVGTLISGSAIAAEAAAGEAIAAQARGQSMVAIADLYRGFSGSLVIASAVAKQAAITADAPVTRRLQSLDGLVIATPSPTSLYTASFRKAAEAVGVKIRFTYMAQPTMAAALETNAIQGMVSGAPFWNASVARGTGVLWISGPRGQLPPNDVPISSAALLVTEATALNDRQLVERLRQVVKDLGIAIAAHPERVEAAEKRIYPDIDPEILKSLVTTEVRNMNTPPFTIEDMKHEFEYVRFSGTSIPNLDALDPAKMLPAY